MNTACFLKCPFHEWPPPVQHIIPAEHGASASLMPEGLLYSAVALHWDYSSFAHILTKTSMLYNAQEEILGSLRSEILILPRVFCGQICN